MIEALADAIVARLKEKFPAGYKVEHFPDAPTRYPLSQARESILVGFEGATFGDLDSIAPLSCEQQTDFSITVIARALRGSLGMMDSLVTARDALFGWRALGSSPFFPVRVGFVAEDQGVWQFVLVMRTNLAVVSATEDENLSGVPFRSAEFVERS